MSKDLTTKRTGIKVYSAKSDKIVFLVLDMRNQRIPWNSISAISAQGVHTKKGKLSKIMLSLFVPVLSLLLCSCGEVVVIGEGAPLDPPDAAIETAPDASDSSDEDECLVPCATHPGCQPC